MTNSLDFVAFITSELHHIEGDHSHHAVITVQELVNCHFFLEHNS